MTSSNCKNRGLSSAFRLILAALKLYAWYQGILILKNTNVYLRLLIEDAS